MDVHIAAYEKGKRFVSPALRQEISLQVIENIKQIDITLLNLEQFGEKIVNLIRDSFELYFVGLYWLAKKKRLLVFTGSGEIGRWYQKSKSLYPFNMIDKEMPIIRAIMLNEIQLRDEEKLSTVLDRMYMASPYIPDARLEIDIPLNTQQGVIGALQICSCVPDSLSKQDIAIFKPIAGQIAPICADLLRTEDEH